MLTVRGRPSPLEGVVTTIVVLALLMSCVLAAVTWIRAQTRHLDSEPEVAAFLAARAVTSGWAREL
jgi:hypothetical protein